MLTASRDLFRRLGFAAALLLALVFAVPAFASHVCLDEPSPTVSAALDADVGARVADEGAACSDCGPACANGCGHAPYSGMTTDAPVHRSAVAFALTGAWNHVVGAPASRPAGPEHPPKA